MSVSLDAFDTPSFRNRWLCHVLPAFAYYLVTCLCVLVVLGLRPMLRVLMGFVASSLSSASSMALRRSLLWRFCSMPTMRFCLESVVTGLLVGPLVCWSFVLAELLPLALSGITRLEAGLLTLLALQVACLRFNAATVESRSVFVPCSSHIWVVNLNGRWCQLHMSYLRTLGHVYEHVADETGVPSCWLRVYLNGRLCPQHMLMSEIGPGAVLRVRAYPLKGEVARDMESFRTFLATLLIARGVPQDVLAKRIQITLDKVPLTAIRQVTSSENPWGSLKSVCNEYMIRILQPDELKAYSDMRELQKQSNSLLPKGPARSGEVGPGSGKVRAISRPSLPAVHATDVDPRAVHVDVQHFRVPDGGGLVRRDSLKFPSDGPGLCVMQLDHIMPYLPPRPIHLDATIVFVISRLAPGVGKFIELPACDEHGRPILVPGTIVQFGSVVAEFVASCPSVDFEPVPATPVEIKS